MSVTGMRTWHRAFRRDVAQGVQLEGGRFGFESEVTAKVPKFGAPMYEIGISYHARAYAEWKTIGCRDGVRAVYANLKCSLFR